MEDGMWSGPTDPECILIVCPMAPLVIPHGKRIDGLVNQTEYHLGDEVVYTCDGEYELNYTDPVPCNNSAQWNPYLPSCELVACDRPPTVDHTIPPGPTPQYVIHTNYTYQCEVGYSAVNRTVQCEYKDGVLGWQGVLPTCTPVYCGAVPNITDGYYDNQPNTSLTSYPFNTQYTYTCVEGYNSTDVYYTNCSVSGEWAPTPGCYLVQCRQPDVLFSIVNDTRPLLLYHTHLRIRCDDSRLYKPPQDIMCGNNGVWVEVNGGKVLSCLQPAHLIHANKWTFGGVGIGMLVILIVLIFVYVVRKKRRERAGNDDIFGDRAKFAYCADNNQLTGGFSNPTYEDNEPGQIAIDRSSSKLVMRGGADRVASTTTQDSDRSVTGESKYDTLHGTKQGGGSGVAAPPDGQYNTLSNLKSHEIKNNTYSHPPGTVPDPTDQGSGGGGWHPEVSVGWGATPGTNPLFDDQYEDDDVYNVPTMGRNNATLPEISPQLGFEEGLGEDVQVNDLYNSVEAADICGSPMETDFDNIIYDNI